MFSPSKKYLYFKMFIITRQQKLKNALLKILPLQVSLLNTYSNFVPSRLFFRFLYLFSKQGNPKAAFNIHDWFSLALPTTPQDFPRSHNSSPIYQGSQWEIKLKNQNKQHSLKGENLVLSKIPPRPGLTTEVEWQAQNVLLLKVNKNKVYSENHSSEVNINT